MLSGMNSWRFYFNFVGGIPISIQKKAAEPFGWYEGHPATYEEKKNGYPWQRNKIIDDCRKSSNDGIWVYEFICFVPRQKYLKPVRKLLATKDAWVYEASTGWTTKGKRFTDIIQHSLGRWSSGGPEHADAVRAGRKGGNAAAKTKKKLAKARARERMPADMAREEYWRDPIYRNANEALAAINADPRYERPWSRGAAYRVLKKRKMRTGPRGPRE